MDPFSIAAEILGGKPLSSGQIAQLRAINAKYQQRVFELVRPAGSAAAHQLADEELAELEAMVRADIVAMLTPEQIRPPGDGTSEGSSA